MKHTHLLLLFCLAIAACEKEDNPTTNTTVEITTNIDTETTWEDIHDDPSVIDYLITKTNFQVNAGLIIQPGVVVAFESAKEMRVAKNGYISAIGTATSPIRFTGKVATSGFWTGIAINSADVRNELTYCTIEYAGGGVLETVIPVTALGVINYAGTAGKIKMTNTTIQFSKGMGMAINDGVDILSFSTNAFKQNALAALQISPGEVSALDANSDFASGNGYNGVEILGKNLDEPVEQTWKKPANGAKYKLLGNMKVLSGLVIEPGTNVEVASDVYIRATTPSGYIVAEGTPTQKIVFEGFVKEAGSWRGLVFNTPDVRNSLKYCTISHGGGGQLESVVSNANIGVINYAGYKGNLTVQNCEITKGAGCGISKNNGAVLNQSSNVFQNIAVNQICE